MPTGKVEFLRKLIADHRDAYLFSGDFPEFFEAALAEQFERGKEQALGNIEMRVAQNERLRQAFDAGYDSDKFSSVAANALYELYDALGDYMLTGKTDYAGVHINDPKTAAMLGKDGE